MAGCFICAMLAVGGTIYIFGLFVVPVSEAFNLSRADTNNGLILNMLGMALWSPVVGRLLDRYSARAIMAFGAAMYAAGFFIIATASSLWFIGLAIIGPIALAVTCAGALAANTVTARWFQRRRGKALGILAVSTSAGGFAMTPLFAALITQFGWQTALSIAAVVLPAAMLAAIIFLIKDRPDHGFAARSKELQPTDGNNAGDVVHARERSWSFAQLAASRNFWCLSLGAGLLLASDAALMATQVPYLLDQNISLAKAALFVSCMTASAVCGKVIVGLLADKFDLRGLFAGVVACHLVLLATLVMMPTYWLLIIIASLFGIAVGGVYPVWLALAAQLFGAKTYGTVIGAMGLVIQPLSIVALRFIGEVHDRTGDYSLGFLTFAIAALLALAFVMLIRGSSGRRTVSQ